VARSGDNERGVEPPPSGVGKGALQHRQVLARVVAAEVEVVRLLEVIPLQHLGKGRLADRPHPGIDARIDDRDPLGRHPVVTHQVVGGVARNRDQPACAPGH
jgi:hypothetical protein